MNGRRRFLVGTVLSIQDGNFIYPACQNCCSRLTHTSCRYECHKCGATCKDARHRYKLCVKVSEERRLRVITIFGRCLEQVFGGSADLLHSQLQVSSKLSGDLEHEQAQELLLRAAEHCLIGRSFIFAVKIPQNFDQSVSPSHLHRNIVACQIILFNEDPMSCTVLSYFNRLLASASSNDPIRARSDISADATNRDLSDFEFPESSSGRPQSWNHYAEYWQQSLGLVSSPLSNTLAENSKYRQGESKGTEQDATSRNTTVSSQRKLNKLMTSISTPGVKCSSSGHVHTNTHIPPSSSHFHSFSSKSKMLLGPESYLQNVRKSGSRRSQSCSASSAHSPPQTAEIHPAREEIFEDFPFSESLSEFITKIEDAEGLRPIEIAQTEENMSGRRSRNSMNVPEAEPSSQNYMNVKSASHCRFDNVTNNMRLLRHRREVVGRTFQSADLSLGCCQESLEKHSPFNSEAVEKDNTCLFDQTSQSPNLMLGHFQESLERQSPFNSEAVGRDDTDLVGWTFQSADLTLGRFQESLERRSPFDSEAVGRDNPSLGDQTFQSANLMLGHFQESLERCSHVNSVGVGRDKTGLVGRTFQSADLSLGRFQESLERRSHVNSEAVGRDKTGLVGRTFQSADLSLGRFQESLERRSPFDSEAVRRDDTGLVDRTSQSADLTLGRFQESLERQSPFDSEAVGRDDTDSVGWTLQSADLTLGRFQDSLEKRSPFDSEAVGRDNPSLVDQTFQSANLTLGRFEESLETRRPFHSLSTWGQGHKRPIKVLSNGMYDSLDLRSVIKDPEKSAVASENMFDGEEKSSDDARAMITSTLKTMGDLYNASADLFEASSDPEDDTLHLQRNGSPYGRLVSLTSSPCTDVLPYRRRSSPAGVGSLSEDCKAWNNSLMEDFSPYLQSTPVLRRLSRTGGLSGDTWRCTGVSIQTKSRSTIRHLFLKGLRQRKSDLFYRLSGDYSLWSPNLSPFFNSEGTTAPFPKTGRKMLSHKPWKMESVVEDKENYDDNNLSCTVKETDTGKEEPIRCSTNTPGNPKHLSPVNRLLQEGEDGLCSGEETLLPSDWSPELFSGKSDMSQSGDCLQRRLF